jgi:hypothetical protein
LKLRQHFSIFISQVHRRIPFRDYGLPPNYSGFEDFKEFVLWKATMRRTQLPISALPAWCKLNDVTFIDTTITNLGAKGYGFVTERSLSSQNTFDIPALLLIPHDLILSAEAIEKHAKVDHHFRQLLDTAGGKVSAHLVP